jgi:Putative metallopeptidase
MRRARSHRQRLLIHLRPASWRGAFISAALLTVSAWAPPVRADDQPNRIIVEYVPPQDSAHQLMYEWLREHHVLERSKELFSPFRLPTDLVLRLQGCDGKVNAWFRRWSVTICYEYLEDIQKNMPVEGAPWGITPTDAILGQYFYVLGHEMGHALFDMLSVPLWGRPEDAADQFSAYIMLQLGKDEARRLILGAAYSYKTYLQNPTVTVRTTAFAGVHGAPLQRFFNLLCIGYGADPDLFADLVGNGYLPAQRARGCRVEFGEVNFAFQQTMLSHVDRELAKSILARDWIPEAVFRPPPTAPDE